MKSKNIDLVPQIFLAVVGVILVGMIIYQVMLSVKSTSKIANTVIASTEETATNYIEYDLTMYDGEEVRGAEVVNFIKKHLGDYSETEEAPIYVEVVSKYSGTTYTNTYTNNVHISEIKDFTKISYYIKPTAIFSGEVIRNENKVILGVKFTQK